ncbi:uncharacterized protein K444DRAFT_617652 [Hyaloscypha bicolor E]|uniref:Uncharacterized protein n=1 Tax=Hyaloscypha bicolor E TaxID=1095630 RepID=A0A2J6SWN7_9HELO|nr:uncharacterized protein K444DRAFT_617652 [Hyaloscypha bicolor E]PMD55187.1 hypothetical protein K444DRAFT_617652 [Hyaloscypha bicolor E]
MTHCQLRALIRLLKRLHPIPRLDSSPQDDYFRGQQMVGQKNHRTRYKHRFGQLKALSAITFISIILFIYLRRS